MEREHRTSFGFIAYTSQFSQEGIKYKYFKEPKALTKKDVKRYIEEDTSGLSKEEKDKLYKTYVGNIVYNGAPESSTDIDRPMNERFYHRLLQDSPRSEKYFIEQQLEYLNSYPKEIKDEFEYIFYPLLELFEEAQKKGGLNKETEAKTKATFTFDTYLNANGKLLLPFLIDKYSKQKIQDIAMMLFALERLKVLTQGTLYSYGQDNLAEVVDATFKPRLKAKKLTRQALNISKYHNNLDAYTAKIDKPANLIEAELQRLTAN